MTEENKNSGSEQRGMDGLTEILRLQAEALSRISERMADSRGVQQETPPGFSTPAHEPIRDPGHLPVRAGDPALNEESLPVLNSFKKFLDQERQRSRKRMIWILAGFSVVVFGVLGIIVVTSQERANALEADILNTRFKAEQARAEAGQEIKQLGEKTTLMATQNANQMRKDITRNVLWAHSVISSNMNVELSGRDSDFDRLKDKLSSLEIENAMVSRKVMELEQRLAELERVREKSEIGILENQIRDQDAITATNRAVSGSKTTPVMINSAKFGRSFQLRIPQE